MVKQDFHSSFASLLVCRQGRGQMNNYVYVYVSLTWSRTVPFTPQYHEYKILYELR